MRRYLFITLLVFESVAFAQTVRLLSKSKNGFISKVEFEGVPAELRRINNVQVMEFPEAVDESKPGTPALPNKTVYIAIPPAGKISVELLNPRWQIHTNVEPAANPKVILKNDSTTSYEEIKLNQSLFPINRYPASDVEILGYTWLGNYYCAVVKINTAMYSAAKRELSELRETDLRITYQNYQSAFKKNNTPLSQYEQDLKKVIMNYEDANDFRSFRVSAFSPDTSKDWIDFTKQYVKLAIPADDIYRITYNDLINVYQVNPASLNPKTFRLFESGKEIPMYVRGEGDMIFDTSDYIEFYGIKHYGSKNYRSIVQIGKDYLNYMDRYSDTTIVWLMWGGINGLRSSEWDGGGSSADTIQSYLAKIHLEKDMRLWYYDAEAARTQLPFWQEHKTWTWLDIGSGTNTTVPFTANSILAQSQCVVTVRYISNAWDIKYPGVNAHKAGLGLNSLNGTDTTIFSHKQTVNYQVKYASSKLIEGNNSVRIQGLTTNPSATVNQFLVDWVDIDYYRKTQAINDSLCITIPDSVAKGFRIIKVTGMSIANPIIYKVSPTFSRIVNYSVSGSSQKTCLFTDTVAGGDRYIVLSETRVKKPRFKLKKSFQNLRSTNRGADYIIVSNKVLSPSVSQYNSFITSEYKVRTEVAYVDDIYDEFYFGYNYPEAIREFLIRANSLWQAPAPTYLMLIGEANYDYKNVATDVIEVKQNLVPSYGYPVSDVWYTTWDSVLIDVPQMYVGRIPAKNDGDVIFYLQKHQKYLQKPYNEWNKTFLFFSGGNPSKPDELTQIRNENNKIYSTIALPPPVGGKGFHFYKTANPVSNYGPVTQQQVKNAISEGSLFISYIGHSGTQTWDNGITAVTDLGNIYSNRYPLISDFGCSTGKFAEPDIDCFGELFVSGDHDGQAISYLGNSSLGYLSTATTFPSNFYSKILKDTVTVIGRAHYLAKIQQQQNGTTRVFNYCNLLFGDPILKIALPRKANLVIDNQSLQLLGNVSTDTDDSASIKIVTKNLGIMAQDSFLVSLNDKLNGNIIFNRSFKLSPNNFEDTTIVKIPVRNRAGEHEILVFVDSINAVDEINEEDNSVSFKLSVYSTAIKSLQQSSFYNAVRNSIVLVNPTQKINGLTESIRFSLDTTEAFSNPIEFTKTFDTVITEVILPALIEGKRYWWKAKINQPELEWSTPSSFVSIQNNAQWFMESPRTSDDFLYDNMLFNQQTRNWELLLARNNLKILSAGTSAGSFVSLEYNGSETSPNTYFWGIVTAKIDSVTLRPYEFRYFLYPSSQSADTLKNYINNLPNGTLLAMSICDDGAQSVLGFSAPTAVRNAIKQLGSYYIDSVKYRESWCIIGKKGAPIGSVPESYKSLYAGVASVSISADSRLDSGIIVFPQIGIASLWDSLTFNLQVPMGANVDIIPLGVKGNKQIDTLSSLSVNSNSKTLLSQVNASIYPRLKLLVKFQANTKKETPKIGNIAVYYKSLPELGTNYQVFKGFHLQNNVPSQEIAPADTILQGEKIQFTYRVYNVGGITAKNIPVKLQSIWDNNYIEPIAAQTIDSIAPESYKEITAQYNTSLGSGKRTIQLSIDPDTTIKEIYKDNNFYSYPIIVKKSTGNPILPNLFITQNAVTSTPSQLTDEIDTAQFSIVYGNSGSIVNDSISIQIKHLYQGNLLTTQIVRRKYPVASDTIIYKIPIVNNAGEHQLSIDLDYNGLVLESSESDNLSNYYFTVATTDFKILHPAQNNISFVTQAVFLNPTVNSGNNPTVNFELDTIPLPSNNSQKYSQSLQQFTSIFPLPGLKKSKRYYWRTKISNDSHDWTTGSFYSGDSSSAAIGQLDSLSWKQNTFIRTAYSPDSGAGIIDTKITIKALSAGFNDGNTGTVEVNGRNVIIQNFGVGHNIAVLDSITFSVLSQRRFDIAANPDESDSLTQFVSSVANGLYVVDVVVDDGANNLKQSTRDALKTIGSKFIDQVSFRDSWTIIGRKGAPIGSVPETITSSGMGIAVSETTIVRIEKSGVIVTPVLGPFTSLSTLSIENSIPAGSQLKIQFVGISPTNSADTLVTGINQNALSLNSVNTKLYRYGKLIFHFTTSSSFKTLRSGAAVNTPILKSWKISSTPSTELAVSSLTSSINTNQVMEGETIEFTSTIYNVSTTTADSVTVQLKTTASGIDQIVKRQRFNTVLSNDSVPFSFSFNTRGRRGNHAFTLEVDPADSVAEQTKSNNSVTIPYIVHPDTLRPTLQITFDGSQIVNGDYVGNRPEIKIRYTDNNPSSLLSSDTSNFKIILNKIPVPFLKGTAELMNTNSAGRADVRWTPELAAGENIIEISAKDISENYSDTILMYVNVETEFRILDLFNLPNPFNSFTHFTFNLAGPANPDEVIIKIYTVAGRLIQEISTSGIIGFNKIPWDGRDKDGDQIGNGVYLYKVIVKQGGKQVEGLSKLVRMR